MLKAVHLQTGLPTAGNAAFRLHEAMIANGIQSTMLAYTTSRPVSNNVMTYTGLKKYVKTHLYRFLLAFIERKKKSNTHLFSYPILIGNNVVSHPAIKNADVIYLHWVVGGFLTLKNIRQLLKIGKPVIFFMHDMWTITGGCHYSLECANYKTGCHYCPIFKGDKKASYASNEFKAKQKLFSEFDNVYFMSPSTWLASCALESGLTNNKPIFCVPNIVDETFFKPIDKSVAKGILNLDPSKRTITFGCVAGTNNKFKGWEYLERALKQVYEAGYDKNIEVLIYGSEYDQATVDAIQYPVKFLGRINDEVTMVIVDNATDLFVFPSLAENFSLSLLENVLCNTPVVGFKVGGVPEIILHKVNGYLAEYKSTVDLGEGILYCLNTKLDNPKPLHYYTDILIQKHKDILHSILTKNYKTA